MSKVELVYPENFIALGLDKRMLNVLTAGESRFRQAVAEVPVEDVQVWEYQGFMWVERLVLGGIHTIIKPEPEGFADLYPVLPEIEKFITSASEYVFEQLPKHPDPKELEDVEHYRRKKFVKLAEAHVRSSDGWLRLLEELPNRKPFDQWESHRDHVAMLHSDANAERLAEWMDEVEKLTGHRPDETDLYTEAKVSRSSFTRWKMGVAGLKVDKTIWETMVKAWNWKKLEGGWTVTVHLLLILRSIS